MEIAEIQRNYRKLSHFINERNGVWYITREGKPLHILKRYSREAVEDVAGNIQLLKNMTN